jgi:hypothetical protein
MSCTAFGLRNRHNLHCVFTGEQAKHPALRPAQGANNMYRIAVGIEGKQKRPALRPHWGASSTTCAAVGLKQKRNSLCCGWAQAQA